MRSARRLTYADSRMNNLLLTLLHLVVMTAKLCGPGGVRAVIAENLVLKQQLIVLRRGRRRATLTLTDRLLCGFGSLFLSAGRIRKVAIAVRPSTLLAFHAALVRRKYRRLFSSRPCPKKPGPKGRWTANLRILEIDEIKTVPHAPLSHPFVERLVGTMRREFLDDVPFWNARDLERKLADFQAYYNAARGHASLQGHTPLIFAGGHTVARAELNQVRWVSHCRNLVQLPVAA